MSVSELLYYTEYLDIGYSMLMCYIKHCKDVPSFLSLPSPHQEGEEE